jgi:hypothetical protein
VGGALLRAAIPLATTILGALLGASLAYWLQRAKALVVVDSIRTTVDYSNDTMGVKIDRQLVQRLFRYDRDLGFFDISDKGSATEREYVSALTGATQILEDEIDNYLPRISQAAKEFRGYLINEDYNLADQFLASEVYPIWSLLSTAVAREDYDIPETTSDSSNEGRRPFHEISEQKDAIVIPLPGPFNIVFGTDFGSSPRAAKLKAVAKQLASAVAYRYRPDLIEMVNAVRTVSEARLNRAKSLLDDVSREMKPHVRLVVEGIIANSGRTAFSVSNRCKFVVKMKGYRSRTRTLRDDVEILFRVGVASSTSPIINADMETRSPGSKDASWKHLDLSTPILVQPGQSQRFTCVSDSVVNDLSFSEELLQAFEGGNQDSYLVLASIRNSRRQFSPIYSRDVVFRDLVYTAPLPRRSSRRLLRFGVRTPQ